MYINRWPDWRFQHQWYLYDLELRTYCEKNIKNTDLKYEYQTQNTNRDEIKEMRKKIKYNDKSPIA